MPLSSDHFTKPERNTKLDNCLINDRDHITLHAKGEHVSKIQAALLMIMPDIDLKDELRTQTYGPLTAEAVWRFKDEQNPKILNKALNQTKPDSIVGIQTITALDQKMVEKERKGKEQPKGELLRISVGTISWIRGSPSPISGLGLQAAEFSPDWVPKTYLGLSATSNSFPPDSVDFGVYRKGLDFRFMTFCQFEIQVDEADQPKNFRVLKAFHDPGFTSPFNKDKFPLAVVGAVFEGDFSVFDRQFHSGEASILSLVSPQARHKNSAISGVPAGETVLVNTLIKARAGKHTDDIGVNNVKSPYHVPWVWCEMVITYAGNRAFKIYGRGSIFPSHAWYFDSKLVATSMEIADSKFPILRGTSSLIEVSRLRLSPVLTAGAPAHGPQIPKDADFGGPVDTHPHTAPGTPA